MSKNNHFNRIGQLFSEPVRFLFISIVLNQISHDGCCLVLGCCGGVGVSGQGEARAAVAQHGGDSFYIDAVLERQCCEGVAEIMEADMLQPASFKIFLWRFTTESG